MDLAQAKLFFDSLEGKSVGGWAIDGLYGSGKSAIVLRGTRNNQHGALKVFHPELIERYGRAVQLERIEREKRLLGLNHPNLVKILGGGECSDSGHLYVVMEPIANKNLQQVLHEIPAKNIPKLISQVASAARFLEELGLAHRDIKPENIAISDDYTSATLLDLGVLKPIGFSSITDADYRPFIGTLRYSSPEFLLRNEPDTEAGWRAVTFYQLGAVLHDMLMRKGLYEEFQEPFANLVQVIEDPKTRPEVYGEDSRSVVLCRNCLVKNPNTRLELVKWEDFTSLVEPAEAKAATDVHDRILLRQQFHRAQCQVSVVEENEPAWKVKRALSDASNQLEIRSLAIINRLGCFPLREIRSSNDIETRSIVTQINFEADEAFGLPNSICFKLELTLVDYNGGNSIFKAGALAILVDAPQTANCLASMETLPFIVAPIFQLLDSPKFEAQFMSVLDAAYNVFDAGKKATSDQFISLDLQGID
jgi:serine/threonine protein kinase